MSTTTVRVLLRAWVLACALAVSAEAYIYLTTELKSLDLSGGPFPIPLASDPANLLGDSVDGYGFVNAQVTFSLSSQRQANPGPASLGEVIAYGSPTGVEPVNPYASDGGSFDVDSLFDVFFDMTITDVDPRPGRDFAGQPDGATIALLDNGPSSFSAFTPGMQFDRSDPNFGLFPTPEADVFVGGFDVEIPLGGDINGNGENDKIKFSIMTLAVADAGRSIEGRAGDLVVSDVDVAMVLRGAVVDESTDPPFSIGGTLPDGRPDPTLFGGKASILTILQNVLVFPEPPQFTAISRSENKVTVVVSNLWPGVSYALDSTTSLKGVTAWSNVTSFAAGSNHMTIKVDVPRAGRTFYRLLED